MDETPRDIRLIERRASARAAASPSGVGAAIALELPDDNALRRFRVRLSDGRLFGWLDVVADAGGLTGAEIEQEVERSAVDLPQEGRLLALEERSPLLLVSRSPR